VTRTRRPTARRRVDQGPRQDIPYLIGRVGALDNLGELSGESLPKWPWNLTNAFAYLKRRPVTVLQNGHQPRFIRKCRGVTTSEPIQDARARARRGQRRRIGRKCAAAIQIPKQVTSSRYHPPFGLIISQRREKCRDVVPTERPEIDILPKALLQSTNVRRVLSDLRVRQLAFPIGHDCVQAYRRHPSFVYVTHLQRRVNRLQLTQ